MLMTKLSELAKISVLSDRVIRILGCNPGPFTLQGTNTYLVGKGKQRVLIDTGEGNQPDYIKLLREVLDSNTVKLSSIILTHWHPDHIGGLEEVLRLVDNEDCKVYKFKSDIHDSKLSGVDISYLDDEQLIYPSKETDDTVLKVFYTPGHSHDHVALLLPQEKALFSGDCILGEGSTVFEDLSAYMDSLYKIKETSPKRIYPGHGPDIHDPDKKIQEYIEHRQSRENSIINILNNASGDGLTVQEIVANNYKDTKRELKRAAEWTVTRHLDKLVKENIVVSSSIKGNTVYRLNPEKSQ